MAGARHPRFGRRLPGRRPQCCLLVPRANGQRATTNLAAFFYNAQHLVAANSILPVCEGTCPRLYLLRRTSLPSLPPLPPLSQLLRCFHNGNPGARCPSPQQVCRSQIYCFAGPQAHAVGCHRTRKKQTKPQPAVQYSSLPQRHSTAATRPSAQPARSCEAHPRYSYRLVLVPAKVPGYQG